jgi:hypothetical protein
MEKIVLERFGNKYLWYEEFAPQLYEDKEVFKISFTEQCQ